jgi:O-antigen/teichoic acid export membrane protein
MESGMKGRILRGFGANGVGQALNVLITLAQLPMLIGAWGPEKNGEWILLTSIPALLLLSEMGFGNAAGNEMTMRTARGELDEAREVFRATWVALTLCSTCIAVLAALLAWLLPWTDWLNFRHITGGEFLGVALLFVLQVLAGQQSLLLSGVYRATERYARGVMMANLLRLAAFLGLALAVFMNWGPLGAALASTAAALAMTGYQMWDARRGAEWASYGRAKDTWATLRPLVRPALAFAAIPLGLSVGIQGISFVIAAVLGPAALTSFDVFRKITRVMVQVAAALKEPVQVELSRTMATRELDGARRLHRQLVAASLWTSLVLAGLLGAAAPLLTQFLGRGKVPFDPAVFWPLALAGVAYGVWSATSAVQLAVNKHQRFTAAFLAAQALAFGLAWPLAGLMGAAGPAVAVASAECLVAIIALPISLKMLGEPMGEFLASLAKAPWRAMRAARA